MGLAIVLAGHGSHISPQTAGIVWEVVDQLRAWGVADEITAAFWKETPSFHTVLNTLIAEQVVIVLLFTAQGYFSRTVIPAEMGLTGTITQRDGRTIILTNTLGEHPDLAQVVEQRVTDTLRDYQLNPLEVAVAVIGHGTPRDRQSRDATRQQVQILTQKALVGEVVDAYLDDEPFIPSIYERTRTPHLIAVPFFLATGSHVTQDVPEALGIQGTLDFVQGRTIYYTPPVGTVETVSRLVLDLVRAAGVNIEIQANVSEWAGFPQSGRVELLEALEAEGELVFGQVRVTKTYVEPILRVGEGHDPPLQNPRDLRQTVRENPFRPLATATDLPTDWRVDITHPDQIHAVLETIYPGVVADWASQRRGDFQPETLTEVAQRQTGIFREIVSLNPDETIQNVCGRCSRYPTWHDATTPHTIPCASPCNFFLSQLTQPVGTRRAASKTAIGDK